MPLTKEQAQLVYETVRAAHKSGQPLAVQVIQDIARMEADAERYRQKAFEGGRCKRSRIGWLYEQSATRCANNAAMMRTLRDMFASWRGDDCCR